MAQQPEPFEIQNLADLQKIQSSSCEEISNTSQTVDKNSKHFPLLRQSQGKTFLLWKRFNMFVVGRIYNSEISIRQERAHNWGQEVKHTTSNRKFLR